MRLERKATGPQYDAGYAVNDYRGSSARLRYPEVPALLLRRILDEELWREQYEERLGLVVRFDSFEEFVNTDPLAGLGGARIDEMREAARRLLELADLLEGHLAKEGSA